MKAGMPAGQMTWHAACTCGYTLQCNEATLREGDGATICRTFERLPATRPGVTSTYYFKRWIYFMRRRGLVFGVAVCVLGGASFSAALAQSPERFRNSVAVGNVTGQSSIPSSAFHADLTPRRFREILQRTLEAADVVASTGNGRYRLDAHVEHVDYPPTSFVPLAVSVRAIVRYTLVDTATGSTVLNTRADETAVVTRLQVPDELTRANVAIRRCAQGTAARLLTSLNDPRQVALR